MAQNCPLYPIAVSFQSLSNVATGTVVAALNGTQPGNFGWLTWAGSPNVPALVRSLTPPGNNQSYVNPDNSADHVVSLGDWIQGKPGISNSKDVRDALDALRGKEIIVPVWDQSRGQGEKAAYHVHTFARVQLLDYRLPGQNQLTVRFLGYETCGTVNQPPRVSAGGDQTILLGETVTLNGSVVDDGQPAGSALTAQWTMVSGPGSVTFSPASVTNLQPVCIATFSAEGSYVLQLVGSDGELSATNRITVLVNRPNQPPQAIPCPVATDEDTPVAVTLEGTDPEGDTLAYEITRLPQHGTLTLNIDAPLLNQFTYLPDPDYNGADELVFRVRDSAGLASVAATNLITIRAVNDPPVADSQAIVSGEDMPLTIALSGADIEGSPLTYAIVTPPTNGTLTLNPEPATLNEFTYTPFTNYHGVDYFTFKVNDGSLDSTIASVTLMLTNVNDAPLVDAGADQIVSFPTNRVRLLGSITDDFFTSFLLTYWNQVSGPGTVTFSPIETNGTQVTCTAAFSAPGVYVLALTADDGWWVESDMVVVTVNARPTVSAGPVQAVTLPDVAWLQGVASDDGLPTNALSVAWSQASGPGPVVFSTPESTNTTAQFSESGYYVLRLTATDSLVTESSEVTILANRRPLVDAGSDLVTNGLMVFLPGRVTDDGYPTNTPLVTAWELISGPGSITLSQPRATNAQPTTTATFSTSGVYVLRLTADDGLSVASDTVTISLNAPPAVEAGGNQTIELPQELLLTGAVDDDSMPAGARLLVEWTMRSGPGEAVFGNPVDPKTTVRFTRTGVYVLRLTVNDSLAETFDEVTITVQPPNTAPVVYAGQNQLVEITETLTLRGLAVDDGLPTGAPLMTVWTQISGPGKAVFANPGLTNTPVTFTAPGNYVLRLSASDSVLSSFAEVTLAVRTAAINAAPVVEAGPDKVVGLTNQVTLTGHVGDDGLPRGAALSIEWSMISGPGTVEFSAPYAATTKVSFSALGTYLLQLVASDSSLTATDLVAVTVFPLNQPPVVDAGPDVSIVIPDPALLLSDGSMPSDPKTLLSRSLLAAPHWNQDFGNPGVSGYASGSAISWIESLDVDNGMLYVAGSFTNAGGIYAKSLARYDGTNWFNFYDSTPISAGEDTGELVGWLVSDCANAEFCSETFGAVAARNGEVFVGGALFKDFDQLDGIRDCTDRWSQGRWHPWGFKRFDGIPRGIKTAGGLVYLIGDFAFQPTNPAYGSFPDLPVSYGVAAWDGTNWLTLGTGIRDFRDASITSTNPLVYDLLNTYVGSLAVGKTGEVYVAGRFIMNTSFGYATNIAKWDGQFWRPLGVGIWDNVGLRCSLAVAENGDLYVGGSFTNAGGLYARRIARWDGNQWHTLGDGPYNGVNSTVESVKIHGQDVYVGGSFTEAGGNTSISRVAKWNGEFWSALGTGSTNGVNSLVRAMDVDETGLYVGGLFSSAGGYPATNIAKWEFPSPPDRDLLLVGRVTDDGLPADAELSMHWIKVSGPGNVTFNPPNQSVSKARFSALGTYVLRLTASDSDLSAYDEVTVTVRGNEAPVVDAGPDQVMGVSEAALLTGTVSDDGLPEGAGLAFLWSAVNGPGSAIFGNQNATNTTVRFTKPGTYVLRLTANDSQFSSYDDVVITMTSDNQPPSAYTASPRTVDFSTPATFSASNLRDDGRPINATNLLWSQLSGPGVITFDNPTGQTTTATFSLPGAYIIRLLLNDSELSTYVDVYVTASLGANAMPIVEAGPNQTNLTCSTWLRGSVKDDGLVESSPLLVYWTKYSGPGEAIFADSNSPITRVSFTKAGTYILRLTANDGLYRWYDEMTVFMPNQAPIVNAGPDRTIVAPTMSLLLTGNASDDGQAYSLPYPTWARVSGPGTVSFSSPYVYTNTATFSTTGSYVLSLTAYDGYVRSTGFVTVVVAPPGNLPPVVNAGPDAVLVWPQTNLTLAGSVTDDGLPSGSSPSFLWTQVSGPGSVLFDDATSPQATASFPAFGKYVLRLTGTDSTLVNGDDVVVELTPAANLAPLVSVESPQTLRITNALTLTGIVTDDGLPLGSTLAVRWEKVSGPGPVYFPGATNVATTLDTIATFPVAGSYVLRLTANDSEFRASSDLAITVLPPDDNVPPVVNAGSDFTAPTYMPHRLHGSFTDDGLPLGGPIAVNWNRISGPATVYFGNAATLDSTATFYATGVYVLRLTMSDGHMTSYDDVKVTVVPAPNEPPFVYAGEDVKVSRPQLALLSAAVFDDHLPVGYPLTFGWSQVSGPAPASLVPESGILTNVYVDTMAFCSATGVYVFRLTATDGQLTNSDDVIVTILPGTNALPLVNAGPDLEVALPQPALLHTEVSDDGLEAGFLEVSWSQVSGPGTAYFSTVNGVYQASFTEPGQYVLRLTASDSQLSASDDVTVTVYAATNPPVVAVTSPLDAALITAPTVVTGTVASTILQSWTLQYRIKPAEALASDPGTTQLENSWTTLASGSAEIHDGPLATFDPTLLLNGIYELKLAATDLTGRTSETEPLTLMVDRNMKIGNFTVSFKDLEIPVAGIPIQVIRTYDSRAAAAGLAGDFGTGWTIDLKNVRLQKNRHLGRNWDSASPQNSTYCLNPHRARIVTLTLPDGQTQKFQAAPLPECQWGFPITAATIHWTPLDNIRGTLVSLDGDGDEVLVDGWAGGSVNLIDYSGNDYNPSRFLYTTDEGEQYVVDEREGLQSVTDRNANTLLVTRNGITWTNLTSGTASLSVQFQRDDLGRITNILDAAGNALTYRYDTNGNLITFVDRVNLTNTFTYDNRHQLLKLTDARGIPAARNEYDEAGRLVAQVDATGHTNYFTHDLSEKREIITDRLGNATVHWYDDDGNIIQTQDALGYVTRMAYDARGNMLMKVDALGNTNWFTYDANDNKLSETDAVGYTTTYTYNRLNEFTSITDKRGNITSNVYDPAGNLSMLIDPQGNTHSFTYDDAGNILTSTDPLGNINENTYDEFGRLTNTLQRDVRLGVLSQTSYAYDAQGNQTNMTTRRTTSAGIETLVTTSIYDAQGRLVSTIQPDGSTTGTVYNEIGKPAVIIDPLGRQTTNTYDTRGNRIAAGYPDGTSEQWAYDAENRLVAFTDKAMRTTTYLFDPLGRQYATVYPDGSGTTNYFDATGRVLATSDERGNCAWFGYDERGLRTSTTNMLGEVTRFNYDKDGALVEMVNALGNTNRYELDALGRRVAVAFPDGTRSTTAYDSLGRRTAQTDQSGIPTAFTYDARGMLLAVTNALGNVTRYEYDAQGRQLAQIDALQRVTRYEYDRAGRRTRRILPLGQVETYAYDAAGNLTNKTDFNGRTTTFAYDSLNRLTARIPDPAFGATPVTFAYNELGLRTNMTDASGSTAYRYDTRNRLAEKATPQGTLQYSYDARGNVTNISSTTPNGVRLSYSYDALNRLSGVAEPHAGETTYTYDSVGNLRGYTLPNGVNSFHQYDSLNRLTNLNISRAVGTLANYAYTVAPSGHRTSATETRVRDPLNPVPNTINRLYHYDATYRLTNETIAAPGLVTPSSLNYAYDAVGNRLTLNSTLAEIPSASYGYDSNDRLLTDTYDDNGNTLVAFGFPMNQPDRYDFENRLIQRAQPGKTVSIVYDGDGNRVRKTVTTPTNTVTTFYLVDTFNPTGYAQVLEEHESLDFQPATLTRIYAFGHALLSQSQIINGAWSASYYGLDGHGNTRFLTDALGQMTDTYDYDAFGNLIAATGSTPNHFLFTTEQFDPDLGLYFLRARYLDTTTGRFWSMDVWSGDTSDPITLHRYLYANDDPADCIDPSGNYSIKELGMTMGIGAIISSAISVYVNWDKTGADFWIEIAKSAGWGAITAPIGGWAIKSIARVLKPLAKIALQPLFRAIGDMDELLLRGGKLTVHNILVRMSRFFMNSTQSYPRVDSTLLGKILKWIAPDVEWDMHHIFIQQAWSRAGSSAKFFDDAVANEGLRRVANGLWNLIPLPTGFHALVHSTYGGVATFATVYYGTAAWGTSFIGHVFYGDE